MTRPRPASRLSIHELHTCIKENNPRYGGNYELQKCVQNWLIAHPPPLVESRSDWRNQIMLFGYRDPNFRKQGNDHSLYGLAGAFSTRINVIVVTTSGHHIQEYNPPENIQHTQALWLIYSLQPGEVQTDTRQGLHV